MAVLNKPVMRVELREGAKTEYGTPEPVVMVEFDKQMHWRAGEAFLHYLAAEISVRSIREQWGVQLGAIMSQGKGRPQRATVRMELADGTHNDAVRCIAMLKQAVAAISKDKNVAVLFQTGRVAQGGGVLTERRR